MKAIDKETIQETTWNLCKKYDAQDRRRTIVLLRNYISLALEQRFGEETENLFRSEWKDEVSLFCQKYGYAE